MNKRDWLKCDFVPLELRVQARVRVQGEAERKVVGVVQKAVDVHTSRAAEISGLPVELITPALRQLGKTVNFMEAYGGVAAVKFW